MYTRISIKELRIVLAFQGQACVVSLASAEIAVVLYDHEHST
jgi:hypothetical protein